MASLTLSFGWARERLLSLSAAGTTSYMTPTYPTTSLAPTPPTTDSTQDKLSQFPRSRRSFLA